MPEDLRSLEAYQEGTDLYRLHFLEKTGSTNDVALSLAREGHPHGTVVIADAQERGRGRHGRRWFSPPGVNIYMSILLRPGTITFHPALVTLAAAAATVEAVNSRLLRRHPLPAAAAWSKWPNDIYCRDRKLGGILTEASTSGRTISSMVTGIGVNVNLEARNIPADFRHDTTSLHIETGEVIPRDEVIIKILDNFRKYYALLFEDPTALITLWCKISRTVGSYVKAVTPGGIVYGKALGIDGRGFLRLGKDNGEEITLGTAEIILLRNDA